MPTTDNAAFTLPLLGSLRAPRISPPTRVTLLRGIMAFRLLVGAWMIVVFVWEIWDRDRKGPPTEPVAHPGAGLALLGLAVLVTIGLVITYRRSAERLVRPLPIVAEIAVGAVMLFADTWVYGAVHSQALPTVWPIAAIFTVAVAGGTRAAVVTGIGLGLSRYAGWLMFPYLTDDGPWSLSRVASTVLFGVAGLVAGYLLEQQEHSDRAITGFRAREEVARTLHDGVLQTLAVVQRRSEDPALVDLARTQEHELREYLFAGSTVDDDIATALRAAARRAEQRYGLRVQVVTAPDLPGGSDDAIHAVRGAVNEALTNASKHGGAESVTIYAEPDDDGHHADAVFVSVKDNGTGFDPATVTNGEGLDRSIRARIEGLGGRVEIDGRPGRGAEVRMYL